MCFFKSVQDAYCSQKKKVVAESGSPRFESSVAVPRGKHMKQMVTRKRKVFGDGRGSVCEKLYRKIKLRANDFWGAVVITLSSVLVCSRVARVADCDTSHQVALSSAKVERCIQTILCRSLSNLRC